MKRNPNNKVAIPVKSVISKPNRIFVYHFGCSVPWIVVGLFLLLLHHMAMTKTDTIATLVYIETRIIDDNP